MVVNRGCLGCPSKASRARELVEEVLGLRELTMRAKAGGRGGSEVVNRSKQWLFWRSKEPTEVVYLWKWSILKAKKWVFTGPVATGGFELLWEVWEIQLRDESGSLSYRPFFDIEI